MKVVATSDFHGALWVEKEIPECDLLLLAGDVCPVNMSHDVHVQRNWVRDKFLPWLSSLTSKAKEIVWIAGNHDFVCEDPSFNEISLNEMPDHVTYLRDEMTVVDGISIYGSPWTPNLPGWAFQADEPKFMMLSESLPKCDILMLHGPPKGILDSVPGWGGVGAPHMELGIAWRAKPQHVVFGHIHEAYGRTVKGDTVFHNVSFMNEIYEGVNPPQTFTISQPKR